MSLLPATASASLRLPAFLSAALALFITTGQLRAQTSAAARSLLLDAGYVDKGRELIAVGERGVTLRSSDNGGTWQRGQCPVLTTLTCLSFDSRTHKGWAAGHGGAILATDTDGKSWTVSHQTDMNDSIFLDILALDSDRVIAVGAYGLALATRDGGKTWSALKPADDDRHLNRITRASDGRLYIAGEQGLLLTSTDQGETWEPLKSPYEGSFFGILPLADGDILAYGLRGHIFRNKADASGEWIEIASGSTGLLCTGLQLGDGTIVLAGQARNFLVSLDGGKTFSKWAGGLENAVAELVELPEGNLLAVGEAGATVLKAPSKK